MKKTLLITLSIAASLSVSNAATIAITNGDFETQFGTAPFLGAPNSFSNNVLTGWTGSTNSGFNYGAVDPSDTTAQPTSGNLAAYVVANGFIEQTLTHTILTGERVEVTLDAWRNNGSGTMTVNFAELGAQTVNLGTSSNEVTNNVITFTATSDITSGVLRFDYTGSTTQARIDTVSAQTLAAVPEPSSAALLGIGGIALILRRKK